jgi:serine/threonine protein phosphatase PrpC
MLDVTRGEERHEPYTLPELYESIVEPDYEDEQEKLVSMDAGVSMRPVKDQDAAYFNPDQGLFGVFDGFGSNQQPQSATAARLAAYTFKEMMKDFRNNEPEVVQEQLKLVMNTIHSKIVEWRDETLEEGATTGVLAKVLSVDTPEGKKHYLVWASVGDSRLYLEDNGNVKQVNRDETIEDKPNVITNSLGNGPGYKGCLQSGFEEITEDQLIMLRTDGVTGDFGTDVLSNEEIAASILNKSAQEGADILVDQARKDDDRMLINARVTRQSDLAQAA